MIEIDLYETRVLGALMEKSITTPDQYPLSLNALNNACNQKSSRDPIMSLEETQVQEILDRLIQKRLVAEASLSGRTAKFKQRFCNTEFSEIHLNPQEFSIICVLFLRGPQSPGELRSRTNRLYTFTDVSEVEETLETLCSRQEGAFVTKLAREPGKREPRYAHLFSGPVDTAAAISSTATTLANPDLSPGEPVQSSQDARILALEQEVASLREEIEALKQVFDL